MGDGQSAVGTRICRVDRDRLLEEASRFAKCRDLLRGLVGQMKVKASHEVMVGLPCCRRFQQRSFNLGFRNVCDQQWRNRAYDLVLNREYIVELSVVPFGPAMRAGLCIDQLCSNAHAITAAADAPFQHVTDTQLAANLADIGSRSLVLE